MNENGCADGYGREWSASEPSMCAQEERQQEEMKRSRTKRIMKMATTTIYNSAIQCNNATMQCNAMQRTRKNARWKERSRDGSNGPAMLEMRRPATRRED